MNGLILANIDDAEDYECSICQGLLRNPSMLLCGHSFCEQCLNDWITRQNVCPQCRSDARSPVPNHFLRGKLDKIIVKCPWHSKGCKWDGPKNRVEEHIAYDCECESGLECPNAELGCPFKGNHADLEIHRPICLFGQLRPMFEVMMRRMNAMIEHLRPKESRYDDFDEDEEGENRRLRDRVTQLEVLVRRLTDTPLTETTNKKFPKSISENEAQKIEIIRGLSYAEANLRTVVQREQNLTSTDFIGATLENADFRGSWLYDCRFVGAVAPNICLRGCGFTYRDIFADYSVTIDYDDGLPFDENDIRMNRINYDGRPAHLQNLRDSFWQARTWENRQVYQQGLTKHQNNLRQNKTDFTNADLRGADFRDADLRYVRFTGADLRGANLIGANIEGVVDLNMDGVVR